MPIGWYWLLVDSSVYLKDRECSRFQQAGHPDLIEHVWECGIMTTELWWWSFKAVVLESIRLYRPLQWCSSRPSLGEPVALQAARRYGLNIGYFFYDAFLPPPLKSDDIIFAHFVVKKIVLVRRGDWLWSGRYLSLCRAGSLLNLRRTRIYNITPRWPTRCSRRFRAGKLVKTPHVSCAIHQILELSRVLFLFEVMSATRWYDVRVVILWFGCIKMLQTVYHKGFEGQHSRHILCSTNRLSSGRLQDASPQQRLLESFASTAVVWGGCAPFDSLEFKYLYPPVVSFRCVKYRCSRDGGAPGRWCCYFIENT